MRGSRPAPASANGVSSAPASARRCWRPKLVAVRSFRPGWPLARSTPGYAYQGEISKDLVQMSPQAAAPAGKGAPHNNMPPSQVLRYCIALEGEFPNRES